MNQNKKRIRLIRTSDNIPAGQNNGLSEANVPECQIMIPGIGRVRTGELHPNFHAAQLSDESKHEIIKQQ
jgi:hypothetical protein